MTRKQYTDLYENFNTNNKWSVNKYFYICCTFCNIASIHTPHGVDFDFLGGNFTYFNISTYYFCKKGFSIQLT